MAPFQNPVILILLLGILKEILSDCNVDNCDINYCSGDGCIKCEDSYYLSGTSCYECQEHCKRCDSYSTCTECERGWHGQTCNSECKPECLECSSFSQCSECIPGHHGPYCQHYCSLACIDILCDIELGRCTVGCKHGYYLSNEDCYQCPEQCTRCSNNSDCSNCKTGYFGTECQFPCPLGCKNQLCDKDFGNCTEGCAAGFYEKGNSCLNCPYRCMSCKDEFTCIECKTGYWGPWCEYDCPVECLRCDQDGHCLEGLPCNVDDCNREYCFNDSCIYCQNGFYLENRACYQCPRYCTKCKESTSCTECVWGRYGSTCEEYCRDTCLDCTDYSVCTDCIPGRYGSYCQFDCPLGCIDILCDRDDGICSFGCRHGYYSGDGVCHQCPEQCTRCANVTECSACISGYYGSYCQYECPESCENLICDKEFGICIDGCIQGYFEEEESCVSCPERCSKCSDRDSCIECKTGYWGSHCQHDCPVKCNRCTQEGHCINDTGCIVNNCDIDYCVENSCIRCMDGYYLSGTTCYQCPEYCTECDGPSSCTQCVRGRHGSVCENECRNTCVDCISVSQCNECIPGRYGTQCELYCHLGCIDIECDKDTGKCIHGCRHGYFLTGEDCTQCPEYCKRCSDFQHCTDCISGYYGSECQYPCPSYCEDHLCDKEYGYCINNCIDGYYSDENSCLICPHRCFSCLDSNLCTHCKTGYWGPQCQYDCSPECLRCTSEGECIDDPDCGIDNCDRGYCLGTSCIKCEDGYYISGTHCYDCPSECTKCIGPSACLECIRGRYGPKCEFTCNSLCTDCTSSSQCTECIPGRHGSFCQFYCPLGCTDILCEKNSGKCTQGCRHGYYLGGDDCFRCPEHCLRCKDMSHCTACMSGYYGYTCQFTCDESCADQICDKTTGRCLEGCVDGYYSQNDSCSKCPAKCVTCVDDSTCLECQSGHWGTHCQHECPVECSSCTSQGICIDDGGICNIDHCEREFCSQTSCIKCEDGYYLAGTHCYQCASSCTKCTSLESCFECTKGRYGAKCEYTCNGLCVECSSSSTCSECIPGRYGPTCRSNCPLGCKNVICDKDSGSCVDGCRRGFYSVGDRCTPCLEQCLSCSDSSHCSLCAPGYYGSSCQWTCPHGCRDEVCHKETGFCTDGCIEGYYFHDYCLRCPIRCSACTDQANCTACKTGYWGSQCQNHCQDQCYKCTIQGHCIDYDGPECYVDHCDRNYCVGGGCLQCDAGYYLYEADCVPCSPDCDLCSSPSLCNKCKKGKYGISCEYSCGSTCSDCISSTECTECIPGRYGSGCLSYCPLGCQNILCDKISGKCTEGCRHGYYLSGEDCIQCSEACTKCVNDSFCTACKPGFYGSLCHKSCHVGCRDQICDIGNGNCTHGCADGYNFHRGYCVEDVVNEACVVAHCDPDNCFASTCALCDEGYYLDGHQCYNCPSNCILCSTRHYCDQCKHGRYGSTCQYECHIGCKDSKCSKDSGFCTEGCNEGHIMKGGECKSCPSHCASCTSMDLCSKCEIGYWGKTCMFDCLGCSTAGCQQNHTCTHGCLDGYYDKITGVGQYDCLPCPGGCTSCTAIDECTACKKGHWGNNCSETCNTNCIGNACHKYNGHCSDGCKSGYYGDTCSGRCSSRCEICHEMDECTVCIAGRHGVMCEQTCSANCFKYACDRHNGTCIYGCSVGYTGYTCETKTFVAIGERDAGEAQGTGAAIGLGVLLAIACFAVAVLTVMLFRKRTSTKEEPDSTPTMMNQTYDTRIGTADFYDHSTRALARPYENTIAERQTAGQGHFDISQRITHYPTPTYNGSDKDYEEAEYSSIKSSNDNIANF